jgi:hypothetical protein
MPSGDSWHNLTVSIKDYAGNQGFFFFQFYINSKLINLRLINGGNYSVFSFGTSIELFADKPLKNLLCNWDNSSFKNCSLSLQPPSSHGFHYLKLIAEDHYGMISQISYILFIDQLAPFIINANPENNSIISNESLTFTYSEQIKTIIYNWSGTQSNSTGNPEINIELRGNSTLSIFIQDQANNWNHLKFHYFVDLNPAELLINDTKSFETNLYYTTVNVTLRLEINDISQMQIISYMWNTSINNSFIDIGKLSDIISPLDPGFYRLNLVTLDKANNWGNYSIDYYIAQNWFEIFIDDREIDYHINSSFLILKDSNNVIISNNTLNINNNTFVSIDNLSIESILLQIDNTVFTASYLDVINKTINFNLIQVSLEIKDFDSGEFSNGTVKIFVESFISSELVINNEFGVNFLTFKGNNRLEVIPYNSNISLIRYLSLKKNIDLVIPSSNTQGYIKIETEFFLIKQAEIYFNGSFVGLTDNNGTIYYSVYPGAYNVLIKLHGGSEFHFFDHFWEFDSKKYIVKPKTTLNIILVTETGIGLDNIEGILYNIDKSAILSIKNSNWQGSMTFENVFLGSYLLDLIYQSTVITKQISIDSDDPFTIIVEIVTSNENIFGDTYKEAKWYNYEDQGSLDIFYSDELSNEIFEKLGFSVAFYAILIIIIGTTIFALIVSIQHPMNIALKRFKTFFLLGATVPQIIISVALQSSIISIFISFIGNLIGILFTYLFPQLRLISIGGLIINSEVDLFILTTSSLFFGVVIFVAMVLSLKKQLNRNDILT